jgi:excisionase family DNA binding protein
VSSYLELTEQAQQADQGEQTDQREQALLSVQEAAATLDISVYTVRRLIASGKLRAQRVKGPRSWEYRVSLGSVSKLIEQSKQSW